MASLERILGDQLNIAVLRWLTSVRGGYSGHEIARRLGRHQSSVRKALERLVETRVITRVDVGNSAAYALNEHLLVVQQVILPLFEHERALRSALLHALVPVVRFSGIDSAVLYGSAARSTSDFRDIDLLIVVARRTTLEDVRDELLGRTDAIERQFGVPVNPIVIDRDTLRSSAYAALLAEVVRDGLLLTDRNTPVQLARVKRFNDGAP